VQRDLLTSIAFPNGAGLASDVGDVFPGMVISADDQCMANVTVDATAASPGGGPVSTVIYVIDKSGSTAAGGSDLFQDIITFFDEFTDVILTYPSTKNVGVVTFGSDEDINLMVPENTAIQTPELIRNETEIKDSYRNVMVDGSTCCSCGFELVAELLDNNTDIVGSSVSLIFMGDGQCNRPANAEAEATRTGTELIENYNTSIISVAVGQVTCALLDPIPSTQCYETENPSDLPLEEIIGTKLISGTIQVESQDGIFDVSQETVFPDSNFSTDLKNETFDWNDMVMVGTYDVFATVVGQDASHPVESTVTDEELAFFQVVDDSPPTITCPDDIEITVDAPPGCDAPHIFTVASHDNCPSNTVQVKGLPSGSDFPEGDTLNKFVITDIGNNMEMCSFTVTVICDSLCRPYTKSPKANKTKGPGKGTKGPGKGSKGPSETKAPKSTKMPKTICPVVPKTKGPGTKGPGKGKGKGKGTKAPTSPPPKETKAPTSPPPANIMEKEEPPKKKAVKAPRILSARR